MLNFLIPAAASLIGGVMSSKATNKASDAAAQAAAQNAQIQREQYNQTRSDLQPYTTLGYSAGNALSHYYGLSPNQGATPAGASASNPYSAYLAANPDITEWARVAGNGDVDAGARMHYERYGQAEGRQLPQTGASGSSAPYAGPTYASDNGPRLDYNDYLTSNPDVAAWTAADGDPSNDAAQAAEHYQQYGRGEGRELIDRSQRPAYGPRPQAPGAPSEGSYFRDFEHSPGYENIRNEALRAVNVGQGAQKTYFSGGRGIALQGKAADLAAQDYNNWFSRQNTLYQAALGQYNQDREFANRNYDVDTSRQDARFDTDRNYSTSRIDTRNNDLFRLLGTGASATSALAGASQNFANNMTANNNSLATAQGNAALAGAGSVNNLLGQAIGAYGMFGNGGGTTTTPKQFPNTPNYGYSYGRA